MNLSREEFLNPFYLELNILFEIIDPEVVSSEPLTRYFFDKKNHFSEKTRRVKFRAFIKPSKSEFLSVSRTIGLIESDIWKLGEEYVAKPNNRTILARADFSVSSILINGLSVIDDQPPPRHAGIGAWPMEKHTAKSVAIEIAATANLALTSSESDTK